MAGAGSNRDIVHSSDSDDLGPISDSVDSQEAPAELAEEAQNPIEGKLEDVLYDVEPAFDENTGHEAQEELAAVAQPSVGKLEQIVENVESMLAPTDCQVAADKLAENEVALESKLDQIASSSDSTHGQEVNKGLTMMKFTKPSGMKLGNLSTYVKDGVVYVHGKVHDTAIAVKVTVRTTIDAATEKALATYAFTVDALKKQQRILQDGCAVASDLVVIAGLETRSIVSSRCSQIKENSLKNLVRCQQVVLGAVPPSVSNRCSYIRATMVGAIVEGTNRCVHLQARLGDLFVTVKATSTSKAIEVFTQARTIAELNVSRYQHVRGTIQGKISGAIVRIQVQRDAGVALTKSKMLAAYGSTKRAIEKLPLAGRVSYGVKVIAGKFGDVFAYSTERYTHALSWVDNNVIYMKTSVSSVNGRVRLQVLEFYVGSSAAINTVLDRAFAIALSRYDAAKASFKALAEPALVSLRAGTESSRLKASAIAVRTKELAVEKPVAAGASSGAVLLGAGGSVVGLASGGVVGAACGVPLALFTFGLSIPVGAIIGGGAGACGGAVVGGAAGAATGSVVGAVVHHREQILQGADDAMAKVRHCKKSLHDTATTSAKLVAARLRSGTGGTA